MSNMPVIDFFIAPFYFVFGAIMRIFKLVCFYADATKCPVFIACWEFIKTFFEMLFTRRQYKKEEYDDEAITRGNGYIEKLIEDISRNPEYEPYSIEDSVVGFNKKVVFVNVSGEAKLHDGCIKGLSTLHRAEACSLQDEGARLRVKADLGAGELEFLYSGSVKFMNFGPTIALNGILSYVGVHLEFTVDSETGKNGKLDKFIIDDMRGMKVRVTGLGPVNWAVNPIMSGVTKIFKRFLRIFLESKVEKHLREKIPDYQFPVEGKTTEDPVTKVTETTGTQTSTTKEPEETDPTNPETSTTKEPEETDPTDSETDPTDSETDSTDSETSTIEESEETVPKDPEISTTKEPEEIVTEPDSNVPEESQDLNSPVLDVDSEEIGYLEPDSWTSESSSDEYLS